MEGNNEGMGSTRNAPALVDTRAVRGPDKEEEPAVERIAVIGMGPQGMEAVRSFARAGYHVLAVDLEGPPTDPDARKSGRAAVVEVGGELAEDAEDAVAVGDVVVIADGSAGAGSTADARARWLRAASETVGRGLTRGAVVCFDAPPHMEAWPGDCVRILEEASGLHAGRDFGIACRVHLPSSSAGAADGTTEAGRHQVVAAGDERSWRAVCAAYGRALDRSVREMAGTEITVPGNVLRAQLRRVAVID